MSDALWWFLVKTTNNFLITLKFFRIMKKIIRFARNHKALIKCTVFDSVCVAATIYGFYCWLWMGCALAHPNPPIETNRGYYQVSIFDNSNINFK